MNVDAVISGSAELAILDFQVSLGPEDMQDIRRTGDGATRFVFRGSYTDPAELPILHPVRDETNAGAGIEIDVFESDMTALPD